jgi:MFS family permease
MLAMAMGAVLVGRRRSLALHVVLLGVAGFLLTVAWQVVSPILPLRLSGIGYTATQVGVLVSLLSLAMGAVELEVGRIAGIFGARWTLLGGVLASSAALIWLAQARAAGMVGAALASVGAARALIWSPLHSSVAGAASEETRGKAFGIFWALTSVGFLAGPAIGGLVGSQYGDRAVFYVGAAVGLTALPWVLATTTPRRPTLRFAASEVGAVLRHPAIFRLCLANYLYYAVTGIWSTFLPLYAAAHGVTVLAVGEIFAVQGLTYALIQIPTGRLADRWGPERLVLPGLVGRSILSLLVLLLHTTPWLLVAAAVYGLVGGIAPVAFTTLMARLSPRERYTTAMGLYNSSGDLGFFLGPLLGGGAALAGIAGPFLLCAPLGVAAIAAGLSTAAAAKRALADSDSL